MNPGIINSLFFGFSWFLFVFLGPHHLLYFFIFKVLNNFKPILGEFIIFHGKYPFDIEVLVFFVFHNELDL